jgi:hypothetical protein
MKMMIKKSLIVLVALIQCASAGFAQGASDKVASVAAPKIAQPLPFKVGETLIYEINFSKLIFSGTIGELKLWVSKPADPKKTELIELRAEAVSKGFFPKLFGLKVNDRFHSIVSTNDLGVHSSTKHIEEGDTRREQKAVFNREDGRVTYIDRDLSKSSGEAKVKEANSPSWIQDILSATYFVRTQKLDQGEVIQVPISDGGAVYNIEVVVAKREEIKVGANKFKTIVLDAKVFDGRYVRRSGQMFIWMTDDERRTPVRAKIKTSGATVTIDLKRQQQAQ